MQAQSQLRILDPHEFAADEQHAFAADVLEGFSRSPKSISSKYFYDDRGSELFQEITQMPEYYPTRVEREILATHAAEICQLARTKVDELQLIELGAGDGHKTFLLIEQLINASADFTYNPIDISQGAMETLIENAEGRFGDRLEIEGLVSEYFQGLNWLHTQEHGTSLVLFLGSNIGNFSLAAAQAFLRRMWHSLNDGDFVLIGFDLKKDVKLLMNAYNDPHGITAEFNTNLLTRMNRELGADFVVEDFQHHAYYNPVIGAMESYLVSNKDQQVYFNSLNKAFEFKMSEPIHTEYSYKYHLSDIERLAELGGFSVIRNFFDQQKYFVDSLWRVNK